MTFASNKWWWEGYAALAWSLLLVIPIFFQAQAAGYIFVMAFVLSPLGLMCGVSALRRGSVPAKAAATVALVVAGLFTYTLILHPRF